MEKFRIKGVIPAAPGAVYRAWLSSAKHSAMTGAGAKVSAGAGGSFTAWDGYISGKNIELKKDGYIKQSWRTAEFDAAAADSILEITLKKIKAGTELTIVHSKVPAGHGSSLKKGWLDYYFKPMKKYFSGF